MNVFLKFTFNACITKENCIAKYKAPKMPVDVSERYDGNERARELLACFAYGTVTV